MKKSVYKVPNGKLLKIFLELSGNKISGLKITGDFFLYPEDAIEKIENTLIGKKIVEAELIATIKILQKNSSIEFFGVDAESIAKAIVMAKGGGK